MNKAYNPAWARHEALQTAAQNWHRRGLLPLPQLQAIRAAYPLIYYRPNIYLQILLFLLTMLGYMAVLGLIFLFTAGLFESTFNWSAPIMIGLAALLAALAGQFALQQLISSSRTYRAGSDQALLYLSLGFAALAWQAFVDAALPNVLDFLLLDSPYLALWLLPVLALLLWATARFGDALLAVLAYVAVMALLANGLLQFGAGRLPLPFAIMALAVGLYQLIRYLAARTNYWYYHACFITLEVLSLATFYLGGNYLIVREGNAAISGLPVSGQIPFAPVFYLLTVLVPLFYLYQGLRRPSRVWLLTGLATLAFSGYTLRFYHSVLPPAVASALLGAFLIGLIAAALRYLRTPQHGLTAAPDNESGERPGLNLEALIVAQTAHAPQSPEPGFQFGGGQSGGGGAEGQW
ncbi:hypothetical protein [Hymenobacter psychrophilus]|uniref:DUF2157 domain-containing protein n=1 Tax=Hymenobacter psychrophilus TaxID=651662 RepID=A0A1H3MN83_9BACT|nr:hypothetical protein [Hymenobacter psychrophilus]SDY77924.1 hypothetical protein SAMN04488069_11369 [Hymenobacter psychrophilus]